MSNSRKPPRKAKGAAPRPLGFQPIQQPIVDVPPQPQTVTTLQVPSTTPRGVIEGEIIGERSRRKAIENRGVRGRYGDGHIEARGPSVWRIRYPFRGERHSKTIHGTKADAKRELRAVLKAGDDGVHVRPNPRLTLAEWVNQWIEMKTAAKSARFKSIKGYREILERHVLPTLGRRPLQQLDTAAINRLFANLDPDLSPRSRQIVRVVLKNCLKSAVKNKLIVANPAIDAEMPKVREDGDDEDAIGQVLEPDELARLVRGFEGCSIYNIVAVGAFTGMRRGEILALRWTDFDPVAKTLRVDRALEYTRGVGQAFKAPKSARGRRTITIDDGLVALLLKLQEQQRRIVAGIPDGIPDGGNSAVALGLVKLPDNALIFPSPGAGDDLTTPRHLDAVSKVFRMHADKIGFKTFRLHDLRGTHETILLDAGTPLHTVAARCGHDPAVLLRWYARRTKKSDQTAAAVIGQLTKAVL